MDDINIEFYTSCATLEEEDGYSCLCVHITNYGIWHDRLNGYDDFSVKTYNTKYLSYQISSDNPNPNNICYIGRDCSDITDKSLCQSALNVNIKIINVVQYALIITL